MARYECSVCGYVHDDSATGGSWDRLPDDWTCPTCGAAKSEFRRVGEPQEAEGAPEVAVAASSGRALLAHRVFGFAFLAIYVLLVVQMVPRLWNYQIEFPARTVVHISLGMAVGAVLLLKISVVRFFRRLDQSLVPMLGTSLLVGSVVLIGISVPFAFHEAVATSRLLRDENRERVRILLAQTGLDEAECRRLAMPDSLRQGQRTLRHECIACHDLRTVLAKPRTPSNWLQTVRRMADRSTMLDPLEQQEQLQVTAYLVALSPALRKSAQEQRQFDSRRSKSKAAAAAAAADQTALANYDPKTAKVLFDNKCSQCHETDLVEQSPPADAAEARELVSWMVDEGLEATEEELGQLIRYLTDSYAKTSE